MREIEWYGRWPTGGGRGGFTLSRTDADAATVREWCALWCDEIGPALGRVRPV